MTDDEINMLERNCKASHWPLLAQCCVDALEAKRLRIENERLRKLVRQVVYARGFTPKNLAIALPDSFYREAEAAPALQHHGTVTS